MGAGDGFLSESFRPQLVPAGVAATGPGRDGLGSGSEEGVPPSAPLPVLAEAGTPPAQLPSRWNWPHVPAGRLWGEKVDTPLYVQS